MPARHHAGAVIYVKIGGEDTAVDNSIGMRQGACEGPILHPFIMQAGLGMMG